MYGVAELGQDVGAAASDTTAVLVGQVSRAEGGSPVENARVALVGRGHVVLTDASGGYRFDDLEPVTVRVRVSFLGAATVETSVDLEPGERARRDFELTVRPLKLEGVGVEVREPSTEPLDEFRRRLERDWGQVIGRNEIERTGGSLARLVARRNYYGPGVRMQRRLGTGSCRPTLFVNGQRAQWLWDVHLAGDQRGNPLHYYDKDEVAAVEIYPPGQLPAELWLSGAAGGGCGAIVIWKRSYLAGAGR